MNLRSEILSDEFVPLLSTFNCGEDCMEDEMNEYLRDSALLYNKSGEGKTTIFIDEDLNCIVGYYTLKCCCMKLDYSDADSVIPSIEISRFATDIKYQHKRFFDKEDGTISDFMIAHAISNIRYLRDNYVGIRTIMVFALDTPNAVGFYRKNRFRYFYSDKCFLNDARGLQPMFVALE
jgi:hypothetical protein